MAEMVALQTSLLGVSDWWAERCLPTNEFVKDKAPFAWSIQTAVYENKLTRFEGFAALRSMNRYHLGHLL